MSNLIDLRHRKQLNMASSNTFKYHRGDTPGDNDFVYRQAHGSSRGVASDAMRAAISPLKFQSSSHENGDVTLGRRWTEHGITSATKTHQHRNDSMTKLSLDGRVDSLELLGCLREFGEQLLAVT